MTVFQTKDGVVVEVGQKEVTADDTSDLYDGDGNTTDSYNVSAANSTSYLGTDLGNVDSVEVSINTQDGAISTSAIGVQVVEARPATEGDFSTVPDSPESYIFFRIADEDGSGEIADDTDITGLTFSVTAYST